MTRLYSKVISITFFAIVFLLTIPISSNHLYAKSASLAGVELTNFPVDKQLLPRNIYTNKGTYDVIGKVYSYSGYDKIRVKVYRDNQLYDTQTSNLYYSGNKANFSFDISITAELKNYDIKIYGIDNNVETLEATAEDVVAGDVYVINGQSNAQAGASNHPTDYDQFSRSYNDEYGWGIINLSFPGQWGARIAKEIIDTEGIPVAIFNQAVGAQEIVFYLKNNSNPYSGNYGTLLSRLETAEVVDDIRAVIWFQGETDGWNTSLANYKTSFTDLYNDWKSDFNMEQCYLYQIRRLSCSHPDPYILEAHRQLAEDIYGLQIMSTNNANHDGCHFSYYNGYNLLGNRMYDLMAKDLYDGSSYEVEAPNIKSANISGNTVVVEMENTVGLNVIGNPWSDFELEGGSAYITGGYVSGKKIYVQVSGSTNGLTGISYLGHPGSANNWITNTTGVGILSWYDFPIGNSTGPGPSGCDAVDINISGNTITVSNLDDAAPNVQTQIFDSNWSQLFNCSYDCGNTESVNLSNGDYKVLVKLYDDNFNSICVINEDFSIGGGIIDNDNDGVPAADDCNDNNASIPTSPGTSCNDYNSNTTNDVIQSDGCTCQGTPVGGGDPDCDNININAGSNGIIISNLDEAPISQVQIFTSSWSTAYTCVNDCQDTENINLSSGTYYVFVKLYTSNWSIICQVNETITVGGNVVDNDNDGVPAGDDCDDNNAFLPATPGTSCNDLNSNTSNDIIQSDGCTCEGTFIGGGIDCNNISISSGNGNITVSGLGSAPISKLQIFDDNWSQVFSCFNDCSNTETINVSNGEYRVFAKLYNSSWQEQCAETQAITVGGSNPPPSNNNGIDLELSITSDIDEYVQYEYITYTVTLENRGSEAAENITVDLPLPQGVSYSNHSTNKGSYAAWEGEWTLSNLGAGQSAVLQLTLFVLVHDTPIGVFAQVASMDDDDIDSTPGNNYNNIPNEDDEAALSLEAEDRSNEEVMIQLAQNRFLVVNNLFPSPVSDVVNLQMTTNSSEALNVKVYSSIGGLQSVHPIELVEGFNQVQFDVSDLPSGMYYLLFETGNRHDPILFVKQRL